MLLKLSHNLSERTPFCDGLAGPAILLVDEVSLLQSLPPLQRVFVIPPFFDGLDSAPCTMFAEV